MAGRRLYSENPVPSREGDLIGASRRGSGGRKGASEMRREFPSRRAGRNVAGSH